MSKLIVLSGIPGSGKSTWAHKYVAEHTNTIILSTDDLRFELFGSYLINSDHEKIMRKTLITRAISAANQNIDVVLDSAVVKNKGRLRWYRQLGQYFDSCSLVIIEADLNICLMRNKQRDRHVPEPVIQEMYSWKEEPNDEVRRAFTNILTIRNDT